MRACDALRQAVLLGLGRNKRIAQAEPAVEHRVGTYVTALPSPRWLPPLATVAALVLGLLIWTEDADARFEEGFGATDSGTFLSRPLGPVRADAVAALDEWILPTVALPANPGGSLGGLFNRPGLLGGFAAGFIGSGVVGLLFGHGVIDELSGVASVLGLMLQLALIVMLARLIWTWWHDDKTAAVTALSPRQLADAYGRSRHEGLPDIDSIDAVLGATESDVLKPSERSHS
jgi:hypothetical protein